MNAPALQPAFYVIIPAYNECQSVGRIVLQLKQLYPSAQVTVVNDGSTDDTQAIAQAAGANVINLPFNVGSGVALHTGLLWARRQQAKVVVTLDADGQHDPQDIEKLITPVLKDQADLILGSRFLPESSCYRVPALRRMGSWVFAQVVSLLTHQRFTDPTTGFQCMNSRVLNLYVNLPDFPEKSPDADIILCAYYHGYRVAEVPVNMRRDEGGGSMHGVLKSLFYVPNMLVAVLGTVLARDSFTKRRK